MPSCEDFGKLIQKTARCEQEDAYSACRTQDPQREYIHRFDTFVTEVEPATDVAQFDHKTVRTEFHADSKAQVQLGG
jgi:hypothetical protein